MVIPDEKRQIYTYVLGQLMSDWSEERYSAGWLHNLENELPFLIREIVTYPAERSELELMQARAMWEIAKGLGHWAVWDAQEWYVAYTPKDWYWPEE